MVNTSKGLWNLYSRFICTAYLQLPRKLTHHINLAGEHVNRPFPASCVLTASPEKRLSVLEKPGFKFPGGQQVSAQRLRRIQICNRKIFRHRENEFSVLWDGRNAHPVSEIIFCKSFSSIRKGAAMRDNKREAFLAYSTLFVRRGRSTEKAELR